MGGVAKGAAIGFGIGSVVPVIGNAVGAVTGAIVGAILGFVGGENIAKGVSYAWDKVKKFAVAAFNVILYPFKLMGQLGKKVWTWLKGKVSEKWEKAKEAAGAVVEVIDKVCSFIKDFGKKIGIWLRKKIQKIPFIGKLFGKSKGLLPDEEKVGELPKKVVSLINRITSRQATKIRSLTAQITTLQVSLKKLKAQIATGAAERAPETIAKAKEIARAQAKEAAIRARALTKPLLDMQEKVMEKTKEEKGSMTTFITNVTNIISSSLQSLTTAVGGERGGQRDPEVADILMGGIL